MGLRSEPEQGQGITETEPENQIVPALPAAPLRKKKWGALQISVLALAGFFPLFWLDGFTMTVNEEVKTRLWLRDFLDPLRDYGALFAQAIILAFAYTIDRGRRRAIVVAAAGVLLTNLLTQVLKISVARFRPEAGLGILAFDVPWMRIFKDARRSFPSGHTSSAFALSVFLANLYPRGRWGFYLIAACCAVTRVLDARHFPTDIYAGAILGTVVARCVLAWEKKRCGAPATGS